MDYQLILAIQTCVQLGDYVISSPLSRNVIGLGKITNAEISHVKLKLFKVMESDILQRHKITPIGSTDYTVAAQDGMVEVYQTSEEVYVERAKIQDIAFILSVEEIESGMFHLAGAANTFFITFFLDRGVMQPFQRSIYFCRYFKEPLNIRLFTMLNVLSQHLRRLMYHLGESEVSSKSFRLPLFSMEAFMYLEGSTIYSREINSTEAMCNSVLQHIEDGMCYKGKHLDLNTICIITWSSCIEKNSWDWNWSGLY
jgi:hypothetical protein